METQSRIREKKIALEKVRKETKDILDLARGPDQARLNREASSKRYDQELKRLTKDLADELRELASLKRGKRTEEWPAWWNLWIGGFIAALIVDWLLDHQR